MSGRQTRFIWQPNYLRHQAAADECCIQPLSGLERTSRRVHADERAGCGSPCAAGPN